MHDYIVAVFKLLIYFSRNSYNFTFYLSNVSNNTMRSVFHEKLTLMRNITLGIALLGITCFMDVNDIANIKGILFALGSGIAYALYMVLMEKRKLVLMNNYKTSFYLALVICGTLLILNIFTKDLIFIQPLKSYFYMIVVALLASFVAIIFLKEGIRIIGSAFAAMFSLFEPVSSIIFGALLFNESVTIIKIIGCVLILFAVFLLMKVDVRN